MTQTSAGLYSGFAFSHLGVLEVRQEYGKTCCTADIPCAVGPLGSLLFLKVQSLALHAAAQASSIK